MIDIEQPVYDRLGRRICLTPMSDHPDSNLETPEGIVFSRSGDPFYREPTNILWPLSNERPSISQLRVYAEDLETVIEDIIRPYEELLASNPDVETLMEKVTLK